jgi:hypothetical protein
VQHCVGGISNQSPPLGMVLRETLLPGITLPLPSLRAKDFNFHLEKDVGVVCPMFAIILMY